MIKNNFKKGFTLIEIIIAISILAVVSVMIGLSLSSFVKSQNIKNTTENVVSLISEARAKTVNGYQGLVYSVYFQSDRATLFSGTTFNSNAATNEVLMYGSNITATTITMSDAGSVLTFSKMSGGANPYGTISMSLDGQVIKTISVNSAGSIIQN